MKKLVTFRLDPALLDQVRRRAQAENRSLTNYVETVLKRHLDQAEPEEASHAPSRHQAENADRRTN